MPAQLYRIARANGFQRAGAGAVIKPSDGLVPASAASTGYYLFSEAGAGVSPLVLVGMANEIGPFLATHPSGIDNRIETFPTIYARVCFFHPGKRFTGLFPRHEVALQLTKDAVGIARPIGGGALPTPALPLDTAVGVARAGTKSALTLHSVVKTFKPAFMRSSQDSAANTLVAVYFHYLRPNRREPGESHLVGRGQVTFAYIHTQGIITNMLARLP